MPLAELKQAYQSGALTKAAYIDAMHAVHQGLFAYADFIPETDIARIEITDGRVVMTTRADRIRLCCDPADKRIAPIEIINFGAYEATEADWMMTLAGGARTILDVGANVGYYTIRLARRAPAATVVAFEPIAATFAYLRYNLELNGVTNTQIHNFGLSDREAEQVFYFSPSNSVNASAARLTDDTGTAAVVCAVRRLDDVAAGQPWQVDFLKCDVEGGELRVFQGAVETLQRHRPVIMTEMLRKWSAKFQYHPNDLLRFLGGLGYQCFTAAEQSLVPFTAMDENTTATNFFFLHRDRHLAQIREFAKLPVAVGR